jgi:hypothetical protein
MNARQLRAWALSALVAMVAWAPEATRADLDGADRAARLIAGLDLDEARRVLGSGAGDDPRIALERARLGIYELDCDGAAAILGRAEVRALPGADALGDIAHGCQRVTAALQTDRDEVRNIEVRWQDDGDRPLAPMLFDTVAKAREVLAKDLGVDWPRPTRVVVVRDLLSLSAMTGLPYDSARTTGTVAVAKWGRVTLLSPRASPHGYPWRDTIAHELTHLAVTRASRDLAPLWLQEGIAKREETRWRAPGPFDDRPPPDAIVQAGDAMGKRFPLDKLGPSIAMLPSADDAMVAFAEVTSFVRFYADTQDPRPGEAGTALPKLLHALSEPGIGADAALVAVSGSDLKSWDERWRAYVASKPRTSLPPFFLEDPKHDRRELDRLREGRDRSRLAELLVARGHAGPAAQQLDRVPTELGATDPSMRWLRGRVLEAAGRRVEGANLVADPHEVASSYGPWWALRGRWARTDRDEGTAVLSFEAAVAADPLDPESACESTDAADSPADPDRARLCAAARARGEPTFGDD